MSQIDVNIIEPLPYLRIMEGIGPRGEKGDKGDTGEVTQAEFDALDVRETSHYQELLTIKQGVNSLSTSKADADDVEDIAAKIDAVLETYFAINSFEVSTDGNVYSDTALVQRGAAIGVFYMRGAFSVPPSVFTSDPPAGLNILFPSGNITLVSIAGPMKTTEFTQRYVSANAIAGDVTVTLSTRSALPRLSKKAYIKFVDAIHYGVAASGSLSDSFLLNTLSNHSLSETKNIVFSVNAGSDDYVWVALPTSYGTPTFESGGFKGGFTSQGVFTHMNNYDYAVEYELWRSVNKGLGNVTVTIS